ncbi:hypothetical protein [Streptomyces sp. NPDC048516]|uniref:hypothetical protein n=1 Tax=Streptomyces sp. NPDC048516 TaxID=3365565 RepID=UPI00371B1028
MSTKRPSKAWRIVIGTDIYPQRSETATRDAVAEHKATTSANRIVIQKWGAGSWSEWLRWNRTEGGNWVAQ